MYYFDRWTDIPLINIRQIGCGSFGTYIHDLMKEFSINTQTQQQQNTTQTQTQTQNQIYYQYPPYSRSTCPNLDFEKDVIGSVDVSAFYICSPDHLHQPHSIACLKQGKHVLCEKPISPSFREVMDVAIKASNEINRYEPKKKSTNSKENELKNVLNLAREK